MRTIFKILWYIVASMGALIMAVSVALAYSTGRYYFAMYDLGLMLTSLFCDLGVFLLLLGSFFLSSRFLWIAPIVLGLAYLAVLPQVWAPHATAYGNVGWMDLGTIIFTAFPAVVSIGGGVTMRWVTFRTIS